MSDVVCPKCGSERFYYNQRVFESHTMVDLPDADGNLDLSCLIDTVVDDDYKSYLHCEGCNKSFDLQLNVVTA